MEAPDPERKATTEAAQPEFDELQPPEELVRRGKARDRLYTTVLQLADPATAAEVAERADVDPGTAREYLRWFADLGVVRHVGDDPERYQANREYLQWRRANKLSEEYQASALVQRLQDVTEDIEAYRAEFETESPWSIDIADTAARRDESVATVWQAVSDWETAEQRRETLQTALQVRRQRPRRSDIGSPAPSGDSADSDTVKQ